MDRFFKLLFAMLTFCSFSNAAIITLQWDKNTHDYGPIMEKALETLAKTGGGTIRIPYGRYPMLSEFNFRSQQPNLNFTIIGVPSGKGELPVLFDNDRIRKPHTFIGLIGFHDAPNITLTIKNINIQGNNIPYSKDNSFFGSGAVPCPAIRAMNLKTGYFENVVIENVYGDGIALVNGHDKGNDKKFRVDRPVIRNCKILNCWSWNGKNDGGDGIMMWYAYKPLIENCTIMNNIPITKSYSRAGIVIEYKSEGAIIRNNIIGGYQRNIHIEGTYGGHLVEHNTFSLSSIAVTLNEVSWGNDATLYSPITIQNNIASYNNIDRFDKNLNRPFRDWSFVSATMAEGALGNVIIKDNKFTYTNNNVNEPGITKSLTVQDNVFVYFRNSKGYNNAKVKLINNTFTLK